MFVDQPLALYGPTKCLKKISCQDLSCPLMFQAMFTIIETWNPQQV